MSGLMGTMVSGMAFGTGSAIAHQAVGAAVGAMSGSGDKAAPQQQQQQQQQAAQPAAANMCSQQQNTFYECLQRSNNNAAACNDYFEALSQCQVNAKAFA